MYIYMYMYMYMYIYIYISATVPLAHVGAWCNAAILVFYSEISNF